MVRHLLLLWCASPAWSAAALFLLPFLLFYLADDCDYCFDWWLVEDVVYVLLSSPAAAADEDGYLELRCCWLVDEVGATIWAERLAN